MQTNVKLACCAGMLLTMGACASNPTAGLGEGVLGSGGKPTIALEAVPSIYGSASPVDVARCDAVRDEIAALDASLGGPATDSAPNTAKPTVSDRLLGYGKDLAVKTALGPVQPVLQTKRALLNEADKERKLREAVERGVMRRAYLIGVADGIPCDFAPVVAVTPPEDAPTPTE